MNKPLPETFILHPRHACDHAYLNGPPAFRHVDRHGVNVSAKIIDREIEAQVKALAANGTSVGKIAKMLGISKATVSMIRAGKYRFGRNY